MSDFHGTPLDVDRGDEARREREKLEREKELMGGPGSCDDSMDFLEQMHKEAIFVDEGPQG